MAVILNIMILGMKIVVFVALSLWFVYDGVITFFAAWYVWILYVCMMLGCLLSLLGTIISKAQKISYISFILFFLGYILMFFYSSAIVEQHGVNRCLDSGRGVWDYNEHRCRTDCWKWDQEHGCYKE